MLSVVTTTGRRGFTLIELLTVVGIMLLLMTLAVWGANGARKTIKLKAARADLTILKSAIEKYKELYHCWPDRSLPHAQGACRNYEIIRLLSNWDVNTPLSEPAGRNRQFTLAPMLETPKAEQLDPHGNWHDPWGTPYSVNILPDDVWHIYQKMASSADHGGAYTPAASELELLQPYGADLSHARYWAKLVQAQVNVYSFGPDRACDWGYYFGDRSGYVKGDWGYTNAGDSEATPVAQRGDDIRANGP